MRKLWFKRRMYGWGWYPACGEGWAVTVGFLVFVLFATIVLTEYIERNPASTPMATLVFLIVMGLVTGGLIFVCYKTGEPPQWQWGDKSNSDDP